MSATVEKKVALTIEMKTAGGQQVGQLTVNLKGLDDASKKAASSGEKTSSSLEKIAKSFLGFLKLGLAVKAVKELGQAFQALITNSLAMQSSGSPLVAQFEAAATKIKVSAASIAGAALPAIDGMATAAADALGEIADFVNTNRELIATDIVHWAVDSGRALVSGLATAAMLANKSITGLQASANLAAQAYYKLNSLLDEAAAEKSGDSRYLAKAKEEQRLADAAFAAAAKNVREMDAFEGKLDALVSKAGVYLGKAEKVGLELAKAKPRFSDPEGDAAAMAAKEREIARYIELATKATTQEQALNASTLAWFALNEQKKMTIAGETASAAIARQEAIADKIRAVNELEVQLQNKFQAKYIADLGARADAQADFAEKLRGLRQSQAEYQAELEDKKKSKTTGSGAPTSFLTDMMKAKEAETFMGPKTEEQMAKDESLMKNHADNVMDLAKRIGAGIGSLMSQTITGIVDGSMTALQAMGNMLGGIISMIGQILIEMGTAALVVAAISAIMGNPGAGAAAAAGLAAMAVGGLMLAAGTGVTMAIGAADGGLVMGGSPNFDSVPALLMRGEYVIPAEQVRQNVAAGRAPDDSGSSRGGGAGAGVTISVTQQSFVPGTKADFNRQVRDAVLPSIRQLARQGLLVLK